MTWFGFDVGVWTAVAAPTDGELAACSTRSVERRSGMDCVLLRRPGPGDGAERLGEGSEPPHQRACFGLVGTTHPTCYLSPTDGKVAVRGTRGTGSNPVERIGEGVQPPHQKQRWQPPHQRAWFGLVRAAHPTCVYEFCGDFEMRPGQMFEACPGLPVEVFGWSSHRYCGIGGFSGGENGKRWGGAFSGGR